VRYTGSYTRVKGQVKLELNYIQHNNVFNNNIKPLHVSANDGHHWQATNISKEIFPM
jgi:hypothetical protein